MAEPLARVRIPADGPHSYSVVVPGLGEVTLERHGRWRPIVTVAEFKLWQRTGIMEIELLALAEKPALVADIIATKPVVAPKMASPTLLAPVADAATDKEPEPPPAPEPQEPESTKRKPGRPKKR